MNDEDPTEAEIASHMTEAEVSAYLTGRPRSDREFAREAAKARINALKQANRDAQARKRDVYESEALF